MSDLAVSWVAVARSAWQQRLRCLAFALGAGVPAATVLVRLTDSPMLAAAAAAGIALLAGGGFARIHPFPDDRAWSVTPDGRIVVRDRDAICRDAAIVYVSSLFIVLRAGRRSLEIWRDATPIPAFRRVSVAARWRLTRDGGSTA